MALPLDNDDRHRRPDETLQRKGPSDSPWRRVGRRVGLDRFSCGARLASARHRPTGWAESADGAGCRIARPCSIDPQARPNGEFDLVVAPAAWLASHREERDSKVVVPAIAVALDLALDDARGRDLLSGWDPGGARRVW